MFVRFTYISLIPERASELNEMYHKEIEPVIRQQHGIKDVMLLSPVNEADEFISCTIWESESDVKAFEASNHYQQVFGKIKTITIKPPSQKYYTAV